VYVLFFLSACVCFLRRIHIATKNLYKFAFSVSFFLCTHVAEIPDLCFFCLYSFSLIFFKNVCLCRFPCGTDCVPYISFPVFPFFLHIMIVFFCICRTCFSVCMCVCFLFFFCVCLHVLCLLCLVCLVCLVRVLLCAKHVMQVLYHQKWDKTNTAALLYMLGQATHTPPSRSICCCLLSIFLSHFVCMRTFIFLPVFFCVAFSQIDNMIFCAVPVLT